MKKDHITIARHSYGDIATKRFFRGEDGEIECDDYPRLKTFDFERSKKIGSARQLGRVLYRLEKDPYAFALRGEPTGRMEKARRVYKGDDAYLRPADRRWVLLDIDSVPLPAGACPVKTARSKLPKEFKSADCFWQLSSSFGVFSSELAKVHLWYWLDRPVCGFSAKEWLKGTGAPIDLMPFNPAQPHYTAAPVFDGVDDPVEKRSGFFVGEKREVSPPLCVVGIDEWTRRRRELEEKRKKELNRALRIAKMNPSFGDGADEKMRRYAEAALNSAVDNIATTAQGQRHHTIFREAASIAGLSAHLDKSRAKALLVQAAEGVLPPKRKKEAKRTVNDAWRQGECEPRDLRWILVDKKPPKPSSTATPTPTPAQWKKVAGDIWSSFDRLMARYVEKSRSCRIMDSGELHRAEQ